MIFRQRLLIMDSDFLFIVSFGKLGFSRTEVLKLLGL